jgi:hypothetical protein
MQTAKEEYRLLLRNYFKGLRLRKPLFYGWNTGLRFDLQIENTNTNEYFEEVDRRASTIFQTVFDSSDKIFVIFMDYKYRRQKIRNSNFVFRQIDNLKKTDVDYTKERQTYQPNERLDIRNVAIIKTLVERVNFRSILTAIGNSDFPERKPRLEISSVFSAKEVYFINIDKKLIFNMYDDRGLDLIAAEVETLRPIYEKHNDWLLEYDRKKIDNMFEQKTTP